MPKSKTIQTNFTAGEFSPRLAGRVDFAKYFNSCKTLQNMVVWPHGGASRRPGTRYVADVKSFVRLVEDCADITDWTDGDTGDGASTQVTYDSKSCFKFDSGSGAGNHAQRKRDIGSFGNRVIVEISIYHSALGTLANADYARLIISHDDVELDIAFASDGLFVYDGAAWNEVGTNLVSTGAWQTWTFDAFIGVAASATVDVYLNGIIQASGVDCSATTPHADGEIYFLQYGDTTANRITYVDYINIEHDGTDGTAEATDVVPAKARLIPFEFSTEQAYIIEAGDRYMRFYMNEGQVQDVDSYTKLLLHCNGNPGSQSFPDSGATGHTVVAHGNVQVDDVWSQFGNGAALFNGTTDYLSIADHVNWFMNTGPFTIELWARFNAFPTNGDTQGLFQQYLDSNNYVYLLLGDSSGNQYFEFVVKDGGSATVGFTSTALSLSTGQPYHIAVIRGWSGNANIWAITLNGVAVGTLTDDSAWPNIAAPFIIGKCDKYGAEYIDARVDEIRVSKGVARQTTDFTPSISEYPAGDNSSGITYEISTPYLQEHLPQLQFAQSADVMWIVHPSYKPRKLTRTGHTDWTLTNYAPVADPFTSANNYPACVAFYEERLWFASTNSAPQKLFSTKSGDFENMTTGANDDDAIAYTIAADQVNVIRWLSPGPLLMLGTTGGEWKVGSPSKTDPVTPTNISVTRETIYGSAWIQPTPVSHATLFVQKTGRKVRELAYQFEVDRYLAPDLSLLAEHITEGNITSRMAYQQEPNSIVWAVRNTDGVLLGLTHLVAHEIGAWHRHVTDGEVESVACIPYLSEDQLWMSVKRTIDGVTKRFIEFMEDMDYGGDLEDAFFVDCGLSYIGAAVTTISGLDHLEGETVSILADGVVLDDQAVSSGTITLAAAASKVHAGLPFTSILETQRLEAAAAGTIQGRIKRISGARCRVYESLDMEAGPDADHLDTMGSRTALFTGDIEMTDFPGDYEAAGRVYIQQAGPIPLNILALILDVWVEGGRGE